MDQETLHALARTNRRAQARSDASRDALLDAIWEAVDQGMPQVEIAKATGFTRERLRQLSRPEYRTAELKRRGMR